MIFKIEFILNVYSCFLRMTTPELLSEPFLILRNSLLNIWTAIWHFSYLNAYLYDLKSLAERILLGPGINAARKNANYFIVMLCIYS